MLLLINSTDRPRRFGWIERPYFAIASPTCDEASKRIPRFFVNDAVFLDEFDRVYCFTIFVLSKPFSTRAIPYKHAPIFVANGDQIFRVWGENSMIWCKFMPFQDDVYSWLVYSYLPQPIYADAIVLFGETVEGLLFIRARSRANG